MYRFGFNLISSSNKSIDLDASFKLLNKESLTINFEIVPSPLLILLNIEERLSEDFLKLASVISKSELVSDEVILLKSFEIFDTLPIVKSTLDLLDLTISFMAEDVYLTQL